MDAGNYGFERSVFENLKDIPRIPELDFVPNAEYAVSDAAGVLYPIISDNQVIVVSGAFFGDEGKGKMVDAIARHPLIRIVMRANSGENAGHTVTINGSEYVFNLVPSAVLVPGKLNLIGSECVMDPVNFMEREISQLVKNGVDYDNLFVGNVYLTLPHHKLMDFLSKPANSSTLQGISEVHSSKVRKKGLRLNHLFGPKEAVAKRLETELKDYFGLLLAEGLIEEQVLARCEEMNSGGNKRFPQHVIDFIKAGPSASDKIEFIIDLYDRVVRNNPAFPCRADTRRLLRAGLRQGYKALIECAQSYVLGNENEKHWASSTSASTSAAGTVASAAYNAGKHKTIVMNVHKMPSSRVGIGANPVGLVPQDWFSKRGIDVLEKVAGKCESVGDIERLYFGSVGENGVIEPAVYRDADGSEYLAGEALAIAWAKKFKERGARTKKPRVLGLFDCVMHYEVNDVQGPYLSISALDRLDDCEKIGVVIAYAYLHPRGEALDSNGKLYSNDQIIRAGDELPCEEVLRYCRPIVKVMNGWKGTPIAVSKRRADAPLPKGVQDLIAVIEHFTGAEVISVGNGPENKDLIYVKKKQSGN